MKISIVTVCLNSANSIAETLDSVLMQSCRPMEYIVIDGVSSDGTLDILEKYRYRFQSAGIEYRYFSEKDRGIYDAMNKGIEKATGDVIGILNSDDSFSNAYALSRVISCFKNYSDAEVVYGLLREIDMGLERVVIRRNYDYFLLDRRKGGGGGSHPSTYIKKSLYDRIGLYDIDIGLAADYDFMIRAKKAGVEFVKLDEVLVDFSVNGRTGSLSSIDFTKHVQYVQLKHGLIEQKTAKKILLYHYLFSVINKILWKLSSIFFWMIPSREINK